MTTIFISNDWQLGLDSRSTHPRRRQPSAVSKRWVVHFISHVTFIKFQQRASIVSVFFVMNLGAWGLFLSNPSAASSLYVWPVRDYQRVRSGISRMPPKGPTASLETHQYASLDVNKADNLYKIYLQSGICNSFLLFWKSGAVSSGRGSTCSFNHTNISSV